MVRAHRQLRAMKISVATDKHFKAEPVLADSLHDFAFVWCTELSLRMLSSLLQFTDFEVLHSFNTCRHIRQYIWPPVVFVNITTFCPIWADSEPWCLEPKLSKGCCANYCAPPDYLFSESKHFYIFEATDLECFLIRGPMSLQAWNQVRLLG